MTDRSSDDFADRPTRPGLHVASDLDDTHDEADVTRSRRVRTRTPVDRAVSAINDAAAAMQRAAIAGGLREAEADAVPGTPWAREMEGRIEALESHRRRLTGEDDRNGRIGRIEARIAATPEERAAEKATIAAVRWTTIKVLGLLSAAAVIAGGGVWAQVKARDAASRAEGRRDGHEEAQDDKIEWLRQMCAPGQIPPAKDPT